MSKKKNPRQTQKSLAAKYEKAFDNPLVGVAELNSELEVLRCNMVFASILQYDPANLKGMHVGTFSHPDDRFTGVEAAAEVERGNRESLMLKKRYVRKDGSVVWCHICSTPIRDKETNAIVEWVSIIVEDTAPMNAALPKEYTDKLEHLEMLISVLMAALNPKSKDLNININPMTQEIIADNGASVTASPTTSTNNNQNSLKWIIPMFSLMCFVVVVAIVIALGGSASIKNGDQEMNVEGSGVLESVNKIQESARPDAPTE